MWPIATILDSTALVHTSKGPQLEPQLTGKKEQVFLVEHVATALQETDKDSKKEAPAVT